MKSHTQVAVIGGGIVGASVLYHLARAGWTDVVLIERDELTSGSTWHAAGGMHTLNGDPNVAKLQEYTIKLYREIEEASGAEPRLEAFVTGLRRDLEDLEQIELRARRLVERMALALQGSLLIRYGDPAVADGLFAVVATAGTTNVGIVDDLEGVAAACSRRELWFHVDAAYGGAALAAPSARHLFRGIEAADSLVIDPHKWLFAPFDCAALLYADPSLAAAAHRQEAAYLEEVNVGGEWSPTHYAYHLTRRVRGLPFWFSLATHGTNAYRDGVETVLQLTRDVAEEIRRRPSLELVLEPELSVILFRRTGWEGADYVAWCNRMLAEQVAFCLPTTWRDERVMRFCFVNPNTTLAQVSGLLDSMATW